MSNKLPRRTFLLGWLGSLLGSWLGQTQTQAAPAAAPHPQVSCSPQPTEAVCDTTVTLSYSANLPAGVRVNPSTGLISGIIALNGNGQLITLTYSSSLVS